jgi:hypothetical protein
MSGNSVSTQDSASDFMHKFVDTFGFSHQGVAGSTSLTLGAAGETQKASESSSSMAATSDATGGGGTAGPSSGTAVSTGADGHTGSSGNALTTNDHASSFSQAIEKTLTFDHQGVAGSTEISFGTASLTQWDSKSSGTSAMLDDGLFGLGSGGGGGNSWQNGSSSGATGSGEGNVFTTNDHAISFDSEMMKSFDFAHQGVAGSTSIGFGTESATHWSNESSSTAAMFDDLFGQGAWGAEGSQALLG